MGRTPTQEPNILGRWKTWLRWALDAYDISHGDLLGWLADAKRDFPALPADKTTLQSWLGARRRILAVNAWRVGQVIGQRRSTKYLNGLTALHAAGYLVPCARILGVLIRSKDHRLAQYGQIAAQVWWLSHGFVDGIGEPQPRDSVERRLPRVPNLHEALDKIVAQIPNAFRTRVELVDLGPLGDPLKEPGPTAWAMFVASIAQWGSDCSADAPVEPLQSLRQYVERLEQTARFSRAALDGLEAISADAPI